MFFSLIKEINRLLALIWGRGITPPPRPRWFLRNNSKTVKAVTLEFWNIRAKFGIHNSPQSPDIGQNSDVGISDFRDSGQSLIKENCHNSRTSTDIDMKLAPVTKLDKRNKTMSKKIWPWCHVKKLWCHCHFSNLLPIWSNPEAAFRMHSL